MDISTKKANLEFFHSRRTNCIFQITKTGTTNNASTKKNNMTLKYPSDIPASWPKLLARKKTKVTIRESIGEETFKVSWQDSELISNPELDIIIIQPNGKEYPCKKDIFGETYELDGSISESGRANFVKKETSTLIQIPEGKAVSVETLEVNLTK